MKNKSTFVLLLLIVISLLFLPSFVMAADCSGTSQDGSTKLCNPLGEGITPQTLIGKVIAAALGIVGSLALLMFIYGGFTWMTSAGSAEKVTKGKGIMVWAAIGLAVIFSSYALVKFVITGLST